MPSYHFRYCFHGVGQGLCASGAVCYPRSRRAFHWLYDCGTLSGRRHIDRLIESRAWGGDPPDSLLDLLVVSHFDSDHINGLVRLLGNCRVRTLLLPYLSLPARLLIAFEEGIGPNDDRVGFFVNPSAFLAAAFPERIGEIVYVPPSGEVGPGHASASSPSPTDNEEIWPPLHIGTAATEPDDVQVPRSMSGGPKVRLLKPGTAMTLAAVWEFVPYNDDPQKPIPVDFVSAVEDLKQQLLEVSHGPERKEALIRLKAKYTLVFGSTPERRNIISLFMYTGPVAGDRACL